jgi:uncharacterized glyoxalase superfamily protein PhnB
MKPTPKDWPRLSASLYCDDPRAEIAWLVKAFGFEVRLVVDGEDGAVMHSELTYGDAVLMIATAGKDGGVSPRKVGGHTGGLFLYVDDADAHCARAREAGATITRELATNDYGEGYWCDRSYGCTDPEGHLWYFAHRVK